MTFLSLFCFGYGYVAHHLAPLITPQRGTVYGTQRIANDQGDLFAWHGQADLSDAGVQCLQSVTHLLISVPPGPQGCPVARQIETLLSDPSHLHSVIYLSTTSVYGDTHGGWVDETAALHPTSDRAQQRIEAEQQWQQWGQTHHVPVQIMRLSGIYGPGRSVFDRMARGDNPIIDAPGHVFNRVHVDDIAQVLHAALQYNHTEIYNVSDDVPAAQSDVMRYAYTLLGQEPPAPVAVADAALSPMAQEFYRDCKRVCNEKIKQDLGITLRYPNYMDGLNAIYKASETQPSA